MSTDPSIRDQTYAYFLMEAPDLLQNIENDLFSLVEDRTPARVHNLMRMTHTLKGAAASVGLEAIKRVSHSLEDVFKALYNPAIEIDPEIEALLFQGYECLRIPLTAELTSTPCDESEVLNRAASVFAQLQEKMGDLFDQQAAIPSSAELGFDITESIFQSGVSQRIADLEQALANSPTELDIADLLNEQASVFVGLAESLALPGFGEIAQTTLTGLASNPGQAIEIAKVALGDFKAAKAAVMGGDRTRGGNPSAALKAFAANAPTLDFVEFPAELDIVDFPDALDIVDFPAAFDESAPLDVVEFPEFADNETVIDLGDAFSAIELEGVSLTDLESPSEVGLEDIFGAIDLNDNLLAQLETPDIAPTGDPSPIDLGVSDVDTTLSLEALFGGLTLEAESDTAPVTPAPDLAPPAAPRPTAPKRPPTSAPTRGKESAASQAVRVDLDKLKRLNYLAGELLTIQNRQTTVDEQSQEVVQRLMRQLQLHRQVLLQMRDWSDRMMIQPQRQSIEAVNGAAKQSSWSPRFDSLEFDTLEMDPYGEFHILLQSALEDTVQIEESAEAISLYSQTSNQTLEKQRRLLTDVRDDLMTASMSPLSELFNRFPRLLQQLAVVHRKPAELHLSGTEVLIDKSVAEKLYDPLLHLIRNGFDHGLESTDARLQAGKPEAGQIQLHAFQRDRSTVIQVIDDGQGLNFDRIFKRAVEKGLLRAEDTATITQTQLINCLFEPGFSTASQISDLSGRGVGMDVVKTQVEALQGSIAVYTEPQRGSTFELRIPLDLNVAKVLVCRAKSQTYAFLAESVQQALLPLSDQIQEWRGQRVLRWQPRGQAEQLIPIRRLSECMEYTNPLPEDWNITTSSQMKELGNPLLLLGEGSDVLALEVDQIVGEQELVIRPVGTLIAPPAYTVGCCILADGRLTLLLDSAAFLIPSSEESTGDHLALSVLSAPNPPTEVDAASLPTVTQILVVDDSITLRQNLVLVLQKAGYQVFQARDGEEALSQLEQRSGIRLVISDVEMPGMNGFEFLSRRAQSPAFAKIPVVMLTSRGSDKHRQMATELGANGYLTKPYLDQELLDKVSSLLV
jgi:two-component system, chemotaxis family, sensor histidine kinase and response regulator PixL